MAFTGPGALLGLGIACAFVAGFVGLWWGSGLNRDEARLWETHARGLEAAVKTRDLRAREDSDQAQRDAIRLQAMREALSQAGVAQTEIEAELARAARENSRLAGELADASRKAEKEKRHAKEETAKPGAGGNGWSVRDIRVFQQARSKLGVGKSR